MKRIAKAERTAKPAKNSSTASRARRRILLADDHPMTRFGLAQLIGGQPDLEVVAEAGTPAEAMTALSKLKVDLLITDLTMPGRSGLDFIKDIQAVQPELPIMVVSMHDELLYAERALKAGARGYVMKEAGGERLIHAIHRVLEGQVYVSEKMSAVILDNLSGGKSRNSNSPIDKLTDREFQIFQMIGSGKGTRQIADELHLSAKTVDVHRGNIKAKLDLKDATALVRHAVRWVETGHSDSASTL